MIRRRNTLRYCALRSLDTLARWQMLELRLNCECCDKDPAATDAVICSFECA
jgi:Protein of unknown function (DUF1272)